VFPIIKPATTSGCNVCKTVEEFAVRFDSLGCELALDVAYEVVDEKFPGLPGLPTRRTRISDFESTYMYLLIAPWVVAKYVSADGLRVSPQIYVRLFLGPVDIGHGARLQSKSLMRGQCKEGKRVGENT
jgi:hypothetical protein